LQLTVRADSNPGFCSTLRSRKKSNIVKGESEHMLTPEGGGIAERPLTGIFPYNGLRGRDACRWRFLLINAGGSPLKPWALPTPSRTFSPAPVLPGALPPDPHTRRCRQQPEHQKMSRLRRILYVFVAVKGRSAIPPPSGVSICSLSPLTVALFVPRRKKCLFFGGIFSKIFFEMTY
jgi:hypothetical protein